MANPTPAEKKFANYAHTIGLGLKYGGGAVLFAIGIIGVLALDIALLAAPHQRSSCRNTSFYFSGLMFYSTFSRSRMDARPLLIASLLLAVVAIGAAFALAVPGVGIGILSGFCIALAALGLGYGLDALAKRIDPSIKAPALEQEALAALSV